MTNHTDTFLPFLSPKKYIKKSKKNPHIQISLFGLLALQLIFQSHHVLFGTGSLFSPPTKKPGLAKKFFTNFFFFFFFFFYYYEAAPCTLLSCAKCMLRARVMSAACCRPTRPEHAEDEWRLWLAANMLLWKPHPFPLRHRTLLSAPLTSNALLRSYSWFDAPSDSNGAPDRKKSVALQASGGMVCGKGQEGTFVSFVTDTTSYSLKACFL